MKEFILVIIVVALGIAAIAYFTDPSMRFIRCKRCGQIMRPAETNSAKGNRFRDYFCANDGYTHQEVK